MFEIGRAEEIGLRNAMNIFPANAELIDQNIVNGDANLELPSNIPAQGFPALDYLLYGLGDSDADILNALSQASHHQYLSMVVDRMHAMALEVSDSWTTGYRDLFIENNGSSATASTDKMVNDFLFYYEKFFRAGKVGIPAGVFSGTKNAQLVEAYYSDELSKELFMEAFQAIQDFFVGISFDGNQNGLSLQDYLIRLDEDNGLDNDLSSTVITQWSVVADKVESIDNSFARQITKLNVILMKK